MANIFLTLDTSFSMSKTWIVSLFRGLFAFFDSLIYTLISWLFRAVFNLANFELYGVYEDMMDRVYVILGIFMLFKITVSLITYLADPDKINDKEQGISKLITRIITVMVMLIGLPTFFSLMTEAQNKILPVIPRIIINSPTTLSSDDVTGISEKLATTMLNGFAHVKTGCSNAAISKPFDFLKVVNDSCESADDSNSDAYAYDYLPIVSTITGVIMIYVIFSFCISVAIRAFKLIILRSISPIPVLSYIDPKAEKDGGAFSTWKKTFFSTWLELFINLGLIYFIIYIIDMLLSGDMYKGFFDGVNFLDGVFLLAFLLIGLLMFARQAPQFIFDALGIKNKGNFSRMLGLGAAAVGGVGAAGAAYRARNQYDADNNRGSHRLRNFGASLFSGAAAVNSGGNAILTTDKPNLLTGFDAQAKNNATELSRINSGSTLGGRLQTRGQTLLFGESDYDRMTREKTGYEAANKAILTYKNTLEKKALEKTDIKIDLDSRHTGINYLEFMSHTEGAKNGNEESLQWFIDHGWSKQVQNGTKRVWDAASHSYIDQPQYKTVADWQSAQLSLDKIKDLQTQEHGKHLVEAVEKYEQTGDTSVFTNYGTEYNDYRLAYDAAKDVNLKVDFSTYGIKGADASKGDTIGIKQALGETNKHVTGVVTDPGYKAAKANAEATKN